MRCEVWSERAHGDVGCSSVLLRSTDCVPRPSVADAVSLLTQWPQLLTVTGHNAEMGPNNISGEKSWLVNLTKNTFFFLSLPSMNLKQGESRL